MIVRFLAKKLECVYAQYFMHLMVQTFHLQITSAKSIKPCQQNKVEHTKTWCLHKILDFCGLS